MSGTKYTVKAELLDAIKKRVYANTQRKVTPQGIQLNDLDIVESLWDSQPYEEVESFSELMALASSGELNEGKFYAIPYQCVEIIPRTERLNIDSPQYTELIETFVVQALSSTTLSLSVKSVQFPEDDIIWDYDDSEVESTGTARSGKVLYRKDNVKNLSAYYDFRGIYTAMVSVDQASFPEWVSGSDYTQGDFVVNNDYLYRVEADLVDSTSISNLHYHQVCFLPNTIIPLSDLFLGEAYTPIPQYDTLTFTNCSDINVDPFISTEIQPCKTNVFVNSSDITIGSDSSDNFIEDCSNISLTSYNYNNYYNGCSDIIGRKGTDGNYIKTTSFCDFSELSTTSMLNCSNIVIETSCENGSFLYNNNVKINSCVNSYLFNCDKFTVGSGLTNCYLRNCYNSSIGNDNYDHKISGLNDSSISHGCYNLSFAYGYDYYSFLSACHIGERCHDFDLTYRTIIENVSWGSGCYNFTTTIEQNNTIKNTTFGKYCTLSSHGCYVISSTVENHVALSGNSFLSIQYCTIHNETSITNSYFGSTYINDCEIGDYSSFQFEGSYIDIDRLTTGSYFRFIQMGSGVAITNVSVGNNVEITGNLYIKNTTIGNSCSVHCIDYPNVDRCIFENAVEYITLNKCSLVGTTFENNVNNYTIERTSYPLYLYDCVFGVRSSNKTIKSEFVGSGSSTKVYNGYIEPSDTENKTYYGSNDKETMLTLKDKSSVALGSNFYDSFNSLRVFTKSISSDESVGIISIARNNEISFLFENTDTSDHDVLIGSNMTNPDLQLTLTVTASSKILFKIMRVTLLGADKLVLLSSTTI